VELIIGKHGSWPWAEPTSLTLGGQIEKKN